MSAPSPRRRLASKKIHRLEGKSQVRPKPQAKPIENDDEPSYEELDQMLNQAYGCILFLFVIIFVLSLCLIF